MRGLLTLLIGTLIVGTALAIGYVAWPQTTPPPTAPTATPEATPATGEHIILTLGDSLTAGLGVDPADNYPAQLQQKLHDAGYANYRVINAGVSGATTADLVSSLPWSLQNQPEIVILVIGANDMFRGVPVAEIAKNLRTIIQQLQTAKIPHIILGGMLASRGLGPEYVREFDGLYPKLATESHITLMPFFLAGVALDPKLNQADGIHPTRAGYTIIVDNLWQYVEGVVGR